MFHVIASFRVHAVPSPSSFFSCVSGPLVMERLPWLWNGCHLAARYAMRHAPGFFSASQRVAGSFGGVIAIAPCCFVRETLLRPPPKLTDTHDMCLLTRQTIFLIDMKTVTTMSATRVCPRAVLPYQSQRSFPFLQRKIYAEAMVRMHTMMGHDVRGT